MIRRRQQFRLYPAGRRLLVCGRDWRGRKFTLVLDAVWVANLACELDEWLSDEKD